MDIDAAGAPPRSAVSGLREAISGWVHQPGDDGYDQARRGWRRGVDARPAVVVEAASAQDVQVAVEFARERRLPLAVLSTGHGTVTACDGGLLLRTTPMAGVQVHADRHAARVGGGAVWGDVVAAAARSGLAPLSGTSGSVGVAGYTLGGGMGWLSRAYGFAADSLLRASVVTAGGDLVAVGPRSRPELFWALRGGGGNFGVVTALTFRLYPVDRMYGGTVVFGADQAADALACYRDWALTEPDAINTTLRLLRLPRSAQVPDALWGRPALALRVLFLGEAVDAERLLAPLRAAAGPPLAGELRPMRFADTATVFGPPPAPSAGHSQIELFHRLSDRVIDAAVGAVTDTSPVSVVEVRHWGGALSRPPEGAGPVGHRDVPFSVVVTASGDGDRPADAAGVEAVAARLRPDATGGSFLNHLNDTARTPTAYTPQDYRRLAAVKRTYDPDNVFGANLNIPPDHGRGSGSS